MCFIIHIIKMIYSLDLLHSGVFNFSSYLHVLKLLKCAFLHIKYLASNNRIETIG